MSMFHYPFDKSIDEDVRNGLKKAMWFSGISLVVIASSISSVVFMM